MPRRRCRFLLASIACLAAACAGDSTSPSGPSPTQPLPTLAAGDRHLCRLAPDGSAWCWGANEAGQLGRGDAGDGTTAGPAPAPVATSLRLVQLAAGTAHTCGLDPDGTAWCWGDGGDGQLAESSPLTQTCGLRPCTATPVASATGLRFARIAAGGMATCGLTPAGQAWCWGRNDRGQLGTDAAPDRCGDYPCSRTPQPVLGGHHFVTLSLSTNGHGCGTDAAGTVWCWGMNVGGQLGDGSVRVDRFEPVRAEPAPALRDADAGGLHTCAHTPLGAAWCWGIDALGAGDTLLESTRPVPVTGGHRFAVVRAARFTSCGLDSDGAAWCWGPNAHGEIGTTPVGSATRFDEPTPVSGGLHFQELAGAMVTWCGLTNDGAVWCWGGGTSGELGTGTTDSPTPLRVPNLP